jgi:branched-chain amino acid aminotransferase
LAVTLAAQAEWPEFTSAVLVPWAKNERSSLVGLKTTSYGENVVALELAHKLGFSEALQCDTHGRLSEGTGSNIFLVHNGELFTPASSAGLLAGITRDLVLDIVTDLGIAINVQDIDTEFLFNAHEAFLTSSTRDVHPIQRLGKTDVLGNLEIDISLAAHDVTGKIAEAFKKLHNQNMEV